jgi:hypothetical protein
MQSSKSLNKIINKLRQMGNFNFVQCRVFLAVINEQNEREIMFSYFLPSCPLNLIALFRSNYLSWSQFRGLTLS